MLRKTKLIYIMGSAVIGVLTVLTVLFAMISTGVIDGRQKKVVFASASAVFTYDGQEHTETQWEIKDGELKSGHTAKVVVSGTQTEVGESVNHISGVILDEQGADVTSDYVIEYAPGTLAVQKRAIGVRSGDGVKNYDGTPLTCDEYEIADGELAEGQTLECRVTGSIVAAGSQENSFVATIRDEKGNDKTENYAITYLPGTLTVNRRKVVFGSIGAEKDYDGEKLVKEECEITAETSLVDGDTYKSYFDASVTDAGSVDNEFTVKIFDKQGNENGSNYDIEYRYGRLTVKPLSVTFKSGDASVTYGDTELTCKTVELTAGRILDAHSYEGVFSAAQKEVGTTENKFTVVIKDADGADKTHNYDITYAYGNLTVTKRPVQFSSANLEKVYDDTPLDNGDEKATITSGSLVPTHNFVAQFSESITDAGSVDNEFTVAILNVLGEDKSGNYEISYVNGTLTVKKCPVQFTSDGAERVYDGTSLECTTKPQMTAGTLADGHDYTPNFTVKVVEAGERDNEFTVRIADGNGADKTENYDVDCVYGKLIISKRPITIQTGSDQKVYDGTALTCADEADYTVIVGSAAEGQTIRYAEAASIVDFGTEENTVTVYVTGYNEDGTISETTVNYEITVLTGTLTVTKRTVTFTSRGDTKTYDGQPLTCQDYELTGNTLLADNETSEAYFNSAPTEAGSVSNDFSVIIRKADGITNSSGNYIVNYVFGTLTIDRRAITIKTGSDQKVYDGYALTCADENDYTIIGTIVEGQTVNYTNAASIVNADTIENTVDAFITGSDGDKSLNYVINYDYGTLTVTKLAITLASNDYEKVYDGLEIEHGGLKAYELPDGETLIPNFAQSFADAGVKNNEFTVNIYKRSGESSNDNYQIVYKYGTLTITRRELTIKTNTASKPYDGKPLVGGIESVAGTVAEGQTIRYNNVTSIVNAETKANTVDAYIITDDENGYDKSKNYVIRIEYGTLTITKRAITFTSESFKKTYDGQPIAYHELVADKLPELAEGETYAEPEFRDTSNFTDVGSADNEFTIKILKSDGSSSDQNYDITYVYGILAITKKAVTFASDDASRAYDGTALYCHSLKVDPTGIAENENWTITYIGSVTDYTPSPVSNTFSVTITKGATDTTTNYDIQYIYGSLQVTKRKVTFSTATATRVYDGQPLTCNQYTIDTAGGIVEGHTEHVTILGAQTIVGTSVNRAEITITDGNGSDVTGNYDPSVFQGSLIVTPRPLTVVSRNAEKDYDETELICHEYDIATTTPVADGQKVIVDIVGSRLSVGSSPNAIGNVKIVDANDETIDYSINYDVKEVEGTLTVKGNAQQTEDPDSDKFTKPDGEKVNALKIYGNYTGKLYLRYESKGDYTGQGWKNGQEYSEYIEISGKNYSLNYLAALICSAANSNKKWARITENVSGMYVLPYYLEPGSDNQTSDVKYTGSATAYTVYYYPSGSVDLSAMTLPSEYAALEAAYKTFVYEKYLQIPDSTKTCLENIIKAQGFNKADADIINAVAKYVQGCAKYNLDFDERLNAENDVVAAFLSGDYPSGGICQHFAASGTMLFRALGIPARYTTGFVASVKQSATTIVTNKEAHAWVEVYLDGKGWIPVEVTGGGPGADDGGNDDNGDVTALTIKPIATRVQYANGLRVEPTQAVMGLSKLTNQGYTYDVEISGATNVPGIWDTKITSFTLYDADGKDVTDQFEIVFKTGILQIYLQEITVTTIDETRVYDGSPFTSQSEPKYSGTLITGHTITLTPNAVRTSVGTIPNSVRTVIKDADGNDVTSLYKINENFGELSVTSRKITITADSLDKVYDETPLECNTYTITGELANGDVAVVVIAGSQTKIGSTKNRVVSVVIMHGDDDVTKNYSIVTVDGTLQVTPDNQ